MESELYCGVIWVGRFVEVEQSKALTSCFSSYTVNKCPFHSLFNAMVLHFCVVILLFKMAFGGDFAV